MATQVQRRKGTTAQHSTFTGASAELTVDTTKNTVVVHDGVTAGGIPLAKENNATLTGAVTLSGGTANGVTYLNGSKVLITGSGLTFDGTNLGIGTTSPTNKLSVTGNANITGNTTLGDATTDNVTVNGYMGVGGAGVNTAAIRVLSTALAGTIPVGVDSRPVAPSSATTSIRSFLSVPGTEAASFTVADAVGFWAANANKGAGSTITNAHGLYIADQTQGTNNYGITSLVSSGTNKWNIYASGTAANYFAGNVGIGTSSPLANFQVKAANPDVYITSDNTGQSDIFFGGTSNPTAGNIKYSDNSNFMAFNTAGSERLRIDSTGKVGIGTSSPTRPLEVAGTPVIFGGARSVIRAADTSAFAQGVGGGIVFTGNASTGQTDALTSFAAINAAKANSTSADTSGNLIFSTRLAGNDLAERMRLDSSGNLIQTVNTTAATLATNNTLTFSIVDNSTLRISVRGSDGTTRTATVALT